MQVLLLCLIRYGMLQAPNFSINGNTVKNSKYKCKNEVYKSGYRPVSYTHLTLPTILRV